MPIRLRAARASAMIRVLPYSNSLIVIGAARLLNDDVGGALAGLREDLELPSRARVFADQQGIARKSAAHMLSDQRCPRGDCRVGPYCDQQTSRQCRRLTGA